MKVECDPGAPLECGDGGTYFFKVPNCVPYSPDRVIVQIDSLFSEKYVDR
jgi:hypothetical protein